MIKKSNNIRNEGFPPGNPFRVPDNYFEGFTQKIELRIRSLEQEQSPENHRNQDKRRSFVRWIAIAAGLALIAAISYLSVQLLMDPGKTVSEYAGYTELIEFEMDNYDIDLLMDTYKEESSMAEMPESTDLNEEIIDFLVNNDIDLQLIIEEL